MTLAQIEAEVERIEALAYDEDEAHLAEDRLYRAVLTQISESGCQDCGVAALATAALKAWDICFSRWCG